MPLLTFVCKDCGRRFECLTKFNESEKPCCPDCGSRLTERSYTGKCYGAIGGSGASCSGSCKNCKGCGKN